MTTSRNTVEIAIETPGSEAAVREFQEVRRSIAELQGAGRAAGQAMGDSLGAPPSAEVRVFDQHVGELVQTLYALRGSMGEVSASVDRLPADLRALTDEMRAAGQETEKTERKVQALHERLEKTGSELQDIGGKLTVGVTAPIALLGGASLKGAMDFEQAMVGVQKTTDITGEDLRKLGEDFKALSELPGRPAAVELAGIAETAGQLGIANSALVEFTETMAALDASTDLTGEQGASQLARFANITRMQQSEFDRLGSTVVALGNAGASTEQEIAEMGLRIAGAGEQVGMTEAQILGVANALASVGLEAEAAGSSISTVLISMANAVATGGDQLEYFAAVAGTSAAEFRSAFREDSAGALATFIEGLKGISDAGGNVFAVMEQLGLSDIRVRDTLLRAANAGGLLRESLDLGSRAWEENIALTKEAEQFYGTTRGELTALLNTVVNVAGEFGGALVPAFRDGLEVARVLIVPIRETVELFSELPEPIRLTVVSVFALKAAAGPTIYVVGTFVQTLGGIAAVAPKATAAIAALRGGTALAGLSSALLPGGAVLVGLGLLATAFFSVRAEAQEAARAAEDTADRVARSLAETQSRLSGMGEAGARLEFTAASTSVQQTSAELARLRAQDAQLAADIKLERNKVRVGAAKRFRLDEMEEEEEGLHAQIAQVEEAKRRALNDFRLATSRLTDLRSEGEAATGVGLPAIFGGAGDDELAKLKDQADMLSAVYESMQARGEDTTAVFMAILDLNRQIEGSIRRQGGAISEYNVAVRGIAGDLSAILAPTLNLDLYGEKYGGKVDLRDTPRVRFTDPVQRTVHGGTVLNARSSASDLLLSRARANAAELDPRGTLRQDLPGAAEGFDHAASIAISSLGAMAQAAVAGSAQMEQVVISSFANIAASAIGASSPWGAAITAVGGVLGALFGRRSQRDVVPVRLEEYSGRALQQQRKEGPDVVLVRLVTPEGQTISETEYHRGRNTRRDAVTRIPSHPTYG